MKTKSVIRSSNADVDITVTVECFSSILNPLQMRSQRRALADEIMRAIENAGHANHHISSMKVTPRI